MKTLALVLALMLLAGAGYTQSETTKSDPVKAYRDAEKAYAEATLEVQRADLRNQKREIIIALTTFTDEQSKAFWPVYDNYEKDLTKLNDDRIAVIKDYARNLPTLTDAKALDLATRAMDFQQKRLALRKTYMDNLSKVLPGILVARIMQLENQLDILIDLQVASEVPLVE